MSNHMNWQERAREVLGSLNLYDDESEYKLETDIPEDTQVIAEALRKAYEEGLERAEILCMEANRKHERNSIGLDRKTQEKIALYQEEALRLAKVIRAEKGKP